MERNQSKNRIKSEILLCKEKLDMLAIVPKLIQFKQTFCYQKFQLKMTYIMRCFLICPNLAGVWNPPFPDQLAASGKLARQPDRARELQCHQGWPDWLEEPASRGGQTRTGWAIVNELRLPPSPRVSMAGQTGWRNRGTGQPRRPSQTRTGWRNHPVPAAS